MSVSIGALVLAAATTSQDGQIQELQKMIQELQQEVSELKSEAMKLFIERDSNWKEHGLEGSKPYLNPHKESKLFNKIMLPHPLFISFGTHGLNIRDKYLCGNVSCPVVITKTIT